MEAHAELVDPEIKAAPPQTAAAPRRPRVLVVEDDPDMRRLVSFMLQRDGYDIVEASSGVGLLAGMEFTTWNDPNESFDAILTDIQMPDLTALEVLGSMPEKGFGTPVLLMSAYGSAENRARARALGAVAFIDKPIDWDKLRIALSKAVSPE